MTTSATPRQGRSAARAALALALVGLVAVCGRNGQRTEEELTEPLALTREDVVVAERATIRSGPRVAGTLEPRERATVRAEVGGTVTAVETEIGSRVRRGALLARIEQEDLRGAYESARSAIAAATRDLEVTRRELERTEALVQAGALAERDLDQARSTVAAAEARLEEARARLVQARRQLDAATVEAPITGLVSERAVAQGDVVAPGALLFVIIDPSSVRLDASVPAESLPQLAIGTAVQFEVRGYPERTFTGRIEAIAPAADPTTRQLRILVAIPNPGGQLVAGLFAEGRVASEAREAVVVPESAVDLELTPPTVKRLSNGVVEQVAVEVGLRDEVEERVEIVSGVEAGDRLLVGAARAVSPGTPVRMQEQARARP